MEGNKHCEIHESWTFIKSEDDQADIPQASSSDVLDSDDGISVISESELGKNYTNSDNELDKATTERIDNEEHDCAMETLKSDLLTPPTTPSPNQIATPEKLNELIKQHDNEINPVTRPLEMPSSSRFKLPNYLVAFIIVVLMIYANNCSIKSEYEAIISFNEQKINDLQKDFDSLKERLQTLEQKISVQDPTFQPKQNFQPKQSFQPYDDEFIMKIDADFDNEHDTMPAIKDVWYGEGDNLVKILDKKNTLPDYCYHFDPNDLFYEYNLENCERKRKKMEDKMKIVQEKKPNDDFETTEQILKSLNDEIQDMKAKKSPRECDKENKNCERKRSKRNNNWISNRKKGREEAREGRKSNDDNWFLERKMDREVQRILKD